MIEIREARIEDYPAFRRMEEKAWAGTEIELITFEQFKTWLEIFPEGFCLACNENEICGHIFAQICEFDPRDKNETRNWEEMTDNGFSIKTHNPNGSTLYIVSLSATHGGSGASLLRYYCALSHNLNKKFLAGSCRLPGLTKFYKNQKEGLITKTMVEKYVSLVYNTIKRCRKNEEPSVFDPVLSIELRAKKESRCGVVIKDFFKDKQSLNWACITFLQNI